MEDGNFLLGIKDPKLLERASKKASPIAKVNKLRLVIYEHNLALFKTISREELSSEDLRSLLTDLLYEIYKNRVKYGLLRPILKTLVDEGALEGDLEELYAFLSYYRIPRGLIWA